MATLGRGKGSAVPGYGTPAHAIKAIDAQIADLQAIQPEDFEAHLAHLWGAEAHEDSRGRYLCEDCLDVMTDTVVPAASSPTGMDMALCAACQGRLPGQEGDADVSA